MNKALDEDYEIPNEQQAPTQQTTRSYANSPATGRRQPSPTYAQTYEDPSGGNGDSKGDEEVYESVSAPYF